MKKCLIAFLALTAFVASAAVFISGKCNFWGSVQIGSTMFNPLNVNGLILWIDIPRQGMVNDSNVNEIIDYSSANRGFTNNTTSTQATNKTGVLNGFPALQFDGVNDVYVGTTWTTNQEFTIQIVLQFDLATGTEAVFCHGSGNTTGYRVLKNINNRNGTCRAIAAQDDGAATTAFECWSFRRTSAPNVTLFINRTNVVIANPTSAMNNPSGGPILCGFEIGGVASFGGRLIEERVWDNDIGFINESNSFTQLCNKYGLP